MAWYYGTYSCGHDGRENIVGPTKNRQWIADRKFEGLCYECYAREEEKKRKKAYEEAMAEAKEMGLPELEGTEKQVKWAVTIREKMIAEYIEKYMPRKETYLKNDNVDIEEGMNYILSQTSARYFIDNRDNMLILMIAEAADKAKELPHREIDKEIEKEANMETTVFPENCEYKEPAEITFTDKVIKVRFLKNDKFRSIVKSLDYTWNGVWQRKIGLTNGPIEDRVVELGNKLLNAGFPICIHDEKLLQKAINAEYEPECTRWIVKNANHEGCFCIKWQEKDEKLYKAARMLPGSKWSNPFVIVKTEYFEEVSDFAKMKGFKFSPGAQELYENAKAKAESASIVAPVKAKKVEDPDKLKEILESSAEIIGDLKDDD